MNRQARPNVLATSQALPILLGHNHGACFTPSTAPVRLRTTNPLRRLLALQVDLPVLVPAFLGATRLRPPGKLPRLALKRIAAMCARQTNRLDPLRAVLATHLLTGKRIGRAASFSPGVAGLVIVWHLPMFSQVPFTATGTATEAGGFSTVSLGGVERAANDARLLDSKRRRRIFTRHVARAVTKALRLRVGVEHFAAGIAYVRAFQSRAHGQIIPRIAGSGTTGAAAALEGFASILIEAEAEYIPIIERRVAYWKARGVQLEIPA